MPSLLPAVTGDQEESPDILLYCHGIKKDSFTKKASKTVFFSGSFCCLSVFFFLSLCNGVTATVAEVGAGADLVPEIDDCSRCSPGGRCVLDATHSFGDLVAHQNSGQTSFRCECYQGYAGPLCDRKVPVGAGYGVDHDKLDGNGISNDIIDDNDDTFVDDFILRLTEGCPLECQNDGQCISVFGGITYACVCPEPFWGTNCEFDGLSEPCNLDCSSIPDGSISRDGGFCVESPDDLVPGDSHTCVDCQQIPVEEEPICENELTCLNEGVCRVKYLFTDATEGNGTSANRPFTCSNSVSISITGVGGTESEFSFWQELPPYKLYCDCPIGFQGEFCEEIDVCGGCQNNGYCISDDTPGDRNSTDDFFSFSFDDDDDDDDDNLFGDDLFNFSGFTFDDDMWKQDDDTLDNVSCTCYSGGCDQTNCGPGTACVGGMCNQNGLVNPRCWGGKCSQRNTINATWSSCSGQDCFSDDFDDHAMSSDSTLQPFCSCKYGYFGDYCEHWITTICIFDEFGNDYQALHDFCLVSDGFCPLIVGNLYCANGGTCGNAGSGSLVTTQTGFEGVHCEIPITPAPTAQPTIAPTNLENSSASYLFLPQSFWIKIVFAVPFLIPSVH
eukprot:jgi/Psemu1/26746/gm1.26746_g